MSMIPNTTTSLAKMADCVPLSAGNPITITVIFTLMCLLSSFGSFITMVCINTNTSLQTNANYFIYGLCVSDLLSSLMSSPLWLLRIVWDLYGGGIICQLTWVTEFTNSLVTCNHILALAGFRLALLRKPFKIWDLPKCRILFFIVFLWTFSFSVSVSMFGVVQDCGCHLLASHVNQTSCDFVEENNCFVTQVPSIIYFAAFLLPMFFIVVCSVMLFRHLLQMRKKSSSERKKKKDSVQLETSPVTTGNKLSLPATSSINKDREGTVTRRKSPAYFDPLDKDAKRKVTTKGISRQKKAIFKVVSLIGSFMLGYLPRVIYIMWKKGNEMTGRSMRQMEVLLLFFLRISELLNPIIYFASSAKLRKTVKALLARCHKFMCRN